MIVRVDKTAFAREKKRLDNLFRAVSQGAFVAAKTSADEYASTVKTGIGVTSPPSFAPSWEPLSKMWLAMKKDRKNQFWAETYGIYRAINTKIITKTTKLIRIFAGILKTTDGDAFDRAQRNEYGIGLGPERPLFEPAKDVSSQMTGSGRRLKSNLRFKQVVKNAVKRVYR